MEKLKLKYLNTEHRRDVWRLIGITTFNAGLMVYSTVRGVMSGNGTLIAEAAHDSGDAMISGARAYAVNKDPEAKDYNENFKKVTYTFASLFAGGAIIGSVIELVDVVQDFSLDDFYNIESFQQRAFNVIDASIVAGGNNGSFSLSQGIEGDTPILHQAKHHAGVDRWASFGAAGAIIVGVFVPGVSEAGGILMGGYTIKEMNPLAKDHHLVHEH
jgi:divalent metal cation (Fe/Co/Zn/Cd) transporter